MTDHTMIKYAERDNVATIMLNRPEKRNAVNQTVVEELMHYINFCEENANIRAIILTGSGKVFCSGGDLGEIDISNESARLEAKRFLSFAHPMNLEIRRMPKPVIAAVNGPAIGGGFALALSCDLIIAAKSAWFNCQYVLNGWSPDGGMTYYLPRLLGDKRTTWLMFTGEMIDAQKGYEMGFVNKVVDDNELLIEANALARRLASSATLAIARTKELINLSWHQSLESQMEYEKQSIARLIPTEDSREAVMAFRDKRKPQFKGR